MNPEDVERRLSDAFASQAQRAVDDQAAPPPLQLDHRRPDRGRRVLHLLAPLAAAAVVAGVAVAIVANRGPEHGHPTAVGPSTTLSTHPSQTVTPATQVAVKVAMAPGEQVGVGMPVVAYFSKMITDGRALQKATTVTVNGQRVDAQWYFVKSAQAGYPVEGHLRMQTYWPAHARVSVSAPVSGLSAGKGMAFAAGFVLTFTTGPATIATVIDAKHEMTLTQDGKVVGSFPVSLGSSLTPTMTGTKIVMQKGASLCMKGPGYSECGIKYTQRLSTSGEYLLAADWNVRNIKRGIDSSNGCTNLLPADAARLYDLMEIGDVVIYDDASGSQMGMGDGFGDWNVHWNVWQQGGLAPTH